MEFLNLSLTTLSIYVGASFCLVYLFFQYYNSRKRLEKKYYLFFRGSHTLLANTFLALTILLFALIILGPHIGKKQSLQESEGIDVSIVLDVSKSMNALDFEDASNIYARIDAAKMFLKKYVTEHPENRYSLIVFAGDAVSVSPLTHDTNIFLNFLQSVDYKNLALQGTNMEKAYELGIQRLSVDSENAALLLISDGGDMDDSINLRKISELQKQSSIYTLVIGIGTQEGAKIPDGRDIFGYTKYQKFQGGDVVTKLNETNLKAVAKASKGEYLSIESIQDIQTMENLLSDIEKKAISQGESSQKLDMSRYLAMFVLVFFILYLYFSHYQHSSHIHHIRS